jgi:hypothetical protein
MALREVKNAVICRYGTATSLSLKPTHQHQLRDHDGNQREQVSRFPNKYFDDVHRMYVFHSSETLVIMPAHQSLQGLRREVLLT